MEIKKYEKEVITIVWENEKHLHSANCTNGLSEVIRSKDKPWIQQEYAIKQAIIDEVSKCHLGVLSIEN